MKNYIHFINGTLTDSDTNEWFDKENPYTGEVWAKIARGNSTDVNKAVMSAKNAFENVWGVMKPTERGKYLVRLAEIIERESVRLGELEVKDNGKLLAEMGSQTKYIINL